MLLHFQKYTFLAKSSHIELKLIIFQNGIKVLFRIVLYHPSQYEMRGTHTGKYFVVVPTRKIRNANEGTTFITSDES